MAVLVANGQCDAVAARHIHEQTIKRICYQLTGGLAIGDQGGKVGC
jgi:hypothetical protein